MIAKRVSAIKESFKSYPNPLLHIDRKNYVSKVKYTEILTSFFERLVFFIITSGKEVTIPARLGTFQVVQYQAKTRHIDWGKTNKYFGEYNKVNVKKKRIYHREGLYRPFFKWSKRKANFLHKSRWAFKLNRPNVRPNSYNKNNPKVSLLPFFREEGYKFYTEPIFINRYYDPEYVSAFRSSSTEGNGNVT
jgi:hypothetical protein